MSSLGNMIPANVISNPNDNKHSEVNVFYNVASRGTSNQLSLATPDDILDYKIRAGGR